MCESIFTANRISGKKNALFPDRITVNSRNVIYEKGEIIGHKRLLISRENISSVYINENIFFAEIIIESRGGQKIIAKGFSKSDVRQIVDLLT